MYHQNIGDVLTPIAIMAIGSVNDDGDSTGVDLRGAVTANPVAATNYEGQIAFLLNAVNTTGTNPTLALKLQHSDESGANYTDVTGGAFTGLTTTTLNGLQKVVIDRSKLKRYVRVNRDIGGTNSPAYTLAITALAVLKNPA